MNCEDDARRCKNINDDILYIQDCYSLSTEREIAIHSLYKNGNKFKIANCRLSTTFKEKAKEVERPIDTACRFSTLMQLTNV